MTPHVSRTSLPGGRLAVLETYTVAPSEDGYTDLFRHLSGSEGKGTLLSDGLGRLVLEGDKYFEGDPLAKRAYGYETHDLSREHSFVQWAIVPTKKKDSKPSVAGILEWLPMSSQEVIISRVYVKRLCRRQGIGTALMHEALRQMTEQGYDTALAFVARRDKSAVHYLESCDFRLVLRNETREPDFHVRGLRFPYFLEKNLHHHRPTQRS